MTGWLDRLRGRNGDAGELPPPAPAVEDMPADRRHRELATPERQVVEQVAAKVLHGWLQNRHQTLVPLSLNLRTMPEAERARIVRFAALAAEAGGREAETASDLAGWLRAGGADEAAIALFERAREEPPPLARALAEMEGPFAPLAFVVALVAARRSGAAGRSFADYVAARLALSSTTIRSAERRYGA